MWKIIPITQKCLSRLQLQEHSLKTLYHLHSQASIPSLKCFKLEWLEIKGINLFYGVGNPSLLLNIWHNYSSNTLSKPNTRILKEGAMKTFLFFKFRTSVFSLRWPNLNISSKRRYLKTMNPKEEKKKVLQTTEKNIETFNVSALNQT